MRVTTAITVLIILLLVSCAAPVSEGNSLDYDTERVTAPDGMRSLSLVGDSRVFAIPEGFLADEWDSVYNKGIPGIGAATTRDVIATQTMYYDTMIISVGINDCNLDLEPYDIVNDLISCMIHAKATAEHVYITTIPGERSSPHIPEYLAMEGSVKAAIVNIYIPIIANNLGVKIIPLADLLNDGIYLKEEYDDGSGIHYTEAAYTEIETLYSNVLQNAR